MVLVVAEHPPLTRFQPSAELVRVLDGGKDAVLVTNQMLPLRAEAFLLREWVPAGDPHRMGRVAQHEPHVGAEILKGQSEVGRSPV